MRGRRVFAAVGAAAALAAAGAPALAGVPVPVPRPAIAAIAAPAVLPSGPVGAATPGRLAKEVFGAVPAPVPPPARAIGSYAKGCLAGGEALPADGPTWQVMRPSRNRAFGHPALVAFVEDLAAAAPGLGLRGILVGDLGQPAGGPMTSGHASHQIGLDADVWLTEMPERRLSPEERDTLPFTSMLTADGTAIDAAAFTPAIAGLIATAARDPRVARIFVHPLIKRALCAGAGEDRGWLRVVRPWYGHFEHMHVRLACPEGSPACVPQAPPPPGDGCGAPLDYWFTPAPYAPKPGATPPAPLTMARMPPGCRALVGLP